MIASPSRQPRNWLKGHSVHTKSGDTELQPKAHDFEDLRLNLGVRGVEVWLEIVETVEVISSGGLVVCPRGLLNAGKNHARGRIPRLFLRPYVPVAIFGVGIAACLLKP